MTEGAIRAIVMSELGMIEADLTPNERIKFAIEITIRLLTLAADRHA